MKKCFSMIAATALLIFSIIGCSRKNGQDTLAPLSIEFDNIAGDQNLQLGTGVYKNTAGETYSVDVLQYYISNISLTRTDGFTYTVPQDSSYFLIREQDAQTRFANVRVPEGEYNRLAFMVGVDSLRNTMDIARRTGVLDPAGGMEGMYWDWNSGYIFFKMEGTSFAVPATIDAKQRFRFHIGGFGGYTAPSINNSRIVSIDLTAAGTAIVKEDTHSNIHLMVDVTKVFDGPSQVRLMNHSQVMFSDYSINIANNYATMFRHDHTEN
ncbi:MbnP family protein [Chitinophaga ginsengisoli]|uniref:Copper-binding protein MbnP-like domain-containing protein n=1 Tax=Chitinophaga ginsengisoli TaxID=363837 RepID=A0A2P8G2E4_9BACT|nr:MbnP family protein [Chitinophaga ginsengisoli]PSL28150.1 hypothetical protein CLV42_10869 [Chitinophaga ginsengisoli]